MSSVPLTSDSIFSEKLHSSLSRSMSCQLTLLLLPALILQVNPYGVIPEYLLFAPSIFSSVPSWSTILLTEIVTLSLVPAGAPAKVTLKFKFLSSNPVTLTAVLSSVISFIS